MNAVSEALMETGATQTVEDEIVNVAAEIEQMEPEKLARRIREALDTEAGSDFHLGGLLSRYKRESVWKDSYESLNEALKSEFGLHPRKAAYLIKIYDDIVEADVPWQKVASIGWVRLKELASILTKENVDEWVAKVNGPPQLSAIQIAEIVAEFKKGSLAKNDIQAASSDLKAFNAKLHEDQLENVKAAIEKAKQEADTENTGVALDAIATHFLTGGKSKKAPSLKELMVKVNDPEIVLNTFTEIWPDIDIQVKM